MADAYNCTIEDCNRKFKSPTELAQHISRRHAAQAEPDFEKNPNQSQSTFYQDTTRDQATNQTKSTDSGKDNRYAE